MNHSVFLALGSNIEDREQHLASAVKKLANHESIRVTKISSIYETDPVGYTDQGKFLNQVIQIKTDLSALELLSETQEIEASLGRKREIKWGPRTLDLDILLYNHENIETETLKVPHPRMLERSFVLIPLAEVAPELQLPQNHVKITDTLDKLIDKKGVRIWKQKNGEDGSVLTES
ncbi:2-amino-4-hydroxy-6-hydroxymethyldihydropteridine diphosphokinase [Bacillus lacus]|uniref:2-amino-4-hydroxy-6-hydroxymethyldihydropteridine diphosphokinase n=1 Tax=Metabacillus lacus TaxID=1983721 RepID=A0A7X2LZJ1_9BACI|nr:2-amino-4-hydroxy-6-hydroxymethyldihydropteridine diphosphokinase [Metabacillus lacus]MRX72983.1 2-amino-4-hydroxy-6-hydroxymethyldihydropteridine diphosphokinase [Metabacillus lacus]